MANEKKQPEVIQARPLPAVPGDEPRHVNAEVISSGKQRALDTFRGTLKGEQPISLPRVVVLQSLSKEVTREEDKLDVGQFYNRLTHEIVGNGKEIIFIPLLFFATRIRMDKDAGLQCRANSIEGPAIMDGGETIDGQVTRECGACKHKLWPRERREKGERIADKDMKKGPACNIVENFPSLLVLPDESPEDYEIILLSFSRSSAKAGQDLRGINAMYGKPWWYYRYKNTIRRAVGGPGGDKVYYKQEIGRAGKASVEEQARAKQILAALGDPNRIEVDDVEETFGSGEDGSPVDATGEERF